MRQRINRTASKIRGGDIIVLPLQGITIKVGPFKEVPASGHRCSSITSVNFTLGGEPHTVWLDRHEAAKAIYGWIRKEEAMRGVVDATGWPGACFIMVLEGSDVRSGSRFLLRGGQKVRVARTLDLMAKNFMLIHENYEPLNPARVYSFAELLHTLNQCRAKPLLVCHCGPDA